MMPKFRKKPVEVEAVQWTVVNVAEMKAFAGDVATYHGSLLTVHTIEGDMTAEAGDWIIKGVKGEFYPCKPDIFQQTYEPVE